MPCVIHSAVHPQHVRCACKFAWRQALLAPLTALGRRHAVGRQRRRSLALLLRGLRVGRMAIEHERHHVASYCPPRALLLRIKKCTLLRTRWFDAAAAAAALDCASAAKRRPCIFQSPANAQNMPRPACSECVPRRAPQGRTCRRRSASVRRRCKSVIFSAISLSMACNKIKAKLTRYETRAAQHVRRLRSVRLSFAKKTCKCAAACEKLAAQQVHDLFSNVTALPARSKAGPTLQQHRATPASGSICTACTN